MKTTSSLFRTPIRSSTLTLGACSALLFAGSVFAQTSSPYPSETNPPARERSDMTSRSDRAFLEKAAECGHREVGISQAVLARLANPGVRTYAEQVIADHTQMMAKVRALAEKKGVTLPVMQSSEYVKDWGSKTKDAAEDYLEEMIDDHENAVDLFEDAVKSSDMEISALAQAGLPTLRQHLARAKELEKTLE